MKFRYLKFIIGLVLIPLVGNISAGDIVSQVDKSCATEIKNYCSQVTMGEGRMLACFYAHEDRLSGQCQYALYSAATQLEHAVSALNYVAGQCEDDIEEFCSSVLLGSGRVVDCLESNAESVSDACIAAMDDVFE